MKKIVIIIFLISLFALLAQMIPNVEHLSKDNRSLIKEFSIPKPFVKPFYRFKIKVDTENDIFFANQEITWKNCSNVQQNKIYFYLPVNAFENNNTEFTKNFLLKSENFTKINFSKISVNQKPVELKFIKTKNEFYSDQTLAYVSLDFPISPDSLLKINLEYSFSIPRSFRNLGYAPGHNFYVFDNFYPRIATLNNDEWILNQVHSYSMPPENKADFIAEIYTPKEYKILTNASMKSYQKNNSSEWKYLECTDREGFFFVLSREHIQKIVSFKSITGENIEINIALRESRQKYFGRVKKSIINSLEFLEKFIGAFPYNSLQVVDVNQASNSANVSVPGMIRINIDLFSLQSLRKIEQDISYLIAKQYFGNTLKVNNTYDSWVNEGVSSYLSDKIYENYYAQPYVYFDFVSYYPIVGLNLFSYNEIPLIYSIGKINYPIEYKSLNEFYENTLTLSLNDSTYKISSDKEYFIVNRLKSKLLLMSLERQKSSANLLRNLKNFYLNNQLHLINKNDFIKFLNDEYSNNIDLVTLLINNEFIDNRILDVRKIGEGKYEIIVAKNTNIKVPIDIEINTEKLSIRKVWQEERTISKIIFDSKDELKSVIIDPERKFISDINFSNNSYLLENKYWGSLSLAIRAFFWFQNALLIMGSV